MIWVGIGIVVLLFFFRKEIGEWGAPVDELMGKQA